MSDQNQLAIEKRIDREITQALSVVSHSGGSMTIQPRSMSECMELAKLMSVSGICIRPMFRGNPGSCLAIILQAMKWGADPFAVANKAFEVNGQLSYEAQLIHAVVNASPVLSQRLNATFSGEGGTRKCLVIGHIKGESETREYESPKLSEITPKNSPLWKTDPDQQLWYYSSRAWARRWVPEILLGIYTQDELSTRTVDLTPAPPEPRREDFTRPKLNGRNEPIDERPEFAVTDNDGVEHSFRVAQHAAGAISGVLDEAARQDVERLDAAWENNLGTVEQLVGEGYEEATALCEAYATHRKALTPPQLAPGPVEEDGYPGSLVTPRRRPAAKAQESPPASETPAPSTGPVNPEPPHSAPAAATVQPSGERPFPGDMPSAQQEAESGPETANEDRASTYIAPPLKQGKPDYRTWALALFAPKVRRCSTSNDLADLLGANEANLERARAPGSMTAADLAEMERIIAEQWAWAKLPA